MERRIGEKTSKNLKEDIIQKNPDQLELSAYSIELSPIFYPDLGSASDWSCRVGNLIQPIRGTTQIWVVRRHQQCRIQTLRYKGGGRLSRPLDKGVSGLQKNFSALRASVWSKNKVGPAPLGPSPGSATDQYKIFCARFSDVIWRGNQW